MRTDSCPYSINAPSPLNAIRYVGEEGVCRAVAEAQGEVSGMLLIKTDGKTGGGLPSFFAQGLRSNWLRSKSGWNRFRSTGFSMPSIFPSWLYCQML